MLICFINDPRKNHVQSLKGRYMKLLWIQLLPMLLFAMITWNRHSFIAQGSATRRNGSSAVNYLSVLTDKVICRGRYFHVPHVRMIVALAALAHLLSRLGRWRSRWRPPSASWSRRDTQPQCLQQKVKLGHAHKLVWIIVWKWGDLCFSRREANSTDYFVRLSVRISVLIKVSSRRNHRSTGHLSNVGIF